jgi:hypothetical protein
MAHWDAALPFFATAVLVVVGQLSSAIVHQRLRGYFQEQINAAKVAVTTELTAESLAAGGDWAGDAVQAAATILLPVSGFFFLLKAHITRWEPAAYFGASAVSLILLLWVLAVSDPTTYSRKYRFLRLSIVNLIALALNVALGVAALFLAGR